MGEEKESGLTAEIVLVIGASCSGKGYGFGEVMKGYFGAFHYETGKFCREQHPEHASSGTYAPDKAILDDIRSSYLNHIASHGQKRFIIDSPRTVEQAQALIEMFTEMEPGCLISVVEIQVDEERSRLNLAHRLQHQKRNDDADPNSVETRVAKYFGLGGILEKVVPFLEKYAGDRYYRINGMMDMKDVRSYSRTQIGPKVFPSC